MKGWFLLLSFSFFYFTAHSQGPDDYRTYWNEANQKLSEAKYEEAIRTFLLALKICPEASRKQIDDKISEALHEYSEIHEGLVEVSSLLYDVSNTLNAFQGNTLIDFRSLQMEVYRNFTDTYTNRKVSISKNDTVEALFQYRIGLEFQKRGNRKAEIAFRKSLSIVDQLIHARPKESDLLDSKIYGLKLKNTAALCWYLMDLEKLEEVELILSEQSKLEKLETANKEQSLIEAIALYQNMLHRYYLLEGQDETSLNHLNTAIQFTQKLIEIDSANLVWYDQQSKYLLNLKNHPYYAHEKNTKLQLGDSSCYIAEWIQKQAGSALLALERSVICKCDRSAKQLDKSSLIEVDGLLHKEKSKVDYLLHLLPKNRELLLLQAYLALEQSERAYLSQKRSLHDSLVLQASNAWVKSINGITVVPENPQLIIKVYDRMRLRSILLEDPKRRIMQLEQIIELIKSNEITYYYLPGFYRIIAETYNDWLGLSIDLQMPSDSITKRFKMVVDFFKQTTFLQNILTYSEALDEYGKLYKQKVYWECSQGEIDSAIRTLQLMEQGIKPKLIKFDYDFLLREQLILANKKLGESLFKKKRYKEGLPYLHYASKWGDSECTKHLVEIYHKGWAEKKDDLQAKQLKKLAVKQGVHKVYLSCTISGLDQQIEITLREHPEDYKYQGVDDIAIWLYQAKGAIISKEEKEKFKRWEQEVASRKIGFPEYCSKKMNKVDLTKNATKKLFQMNHASIPKRIYQ